MLTIFSTCRSFKNPIFSLIQNNAIRSWLRLDPTPEILLFGDEPGSSEICEELKLVHIPEIEISETMAPRLDIMMTVAEKIATNDTLLLLASDTIVFQDTIQAIPKITLPHFMCCVRRHEKTIDYLIKFESGWEEMVKKDAIWGHPGAGDYFLYQKRFYQDVPPFLIGRASCDGWLIYDAARRDMCIDLSPCVYTLHQSHDHSHVPGNLDGLIASADFHKGREMAGVGVSYQIAHSNWILNHSGLTRR